MIYFRCDVSETIGWGNLKRCLVLAEALNKYTSTCFFLSNPDTRVLNLIVAVGSSVYEVPAGLTYAEEVEHYPSDFRNIIIDLGHRENLNNPNDLLNYLDVLSAQEKNIIIFDGLEDDSFRNSRAPRVLAYIQPYLGVNEDNPPNSKYWFFGAEYILLDKIYENAYRKRSTRSIKKVLITFGGADPQGNTIKVLRGISNETSLDIKVIVGPSFSEENTMKIDNFSTYNNINMVYFPENLIKYYNWADLGVCGSGASRYEALACGLPVICTAIYSEHHKLSVKFASLGTSKYVGLCSELSSSDWRDELNLLREDNEGYISMLRSIEKMQHTENGAENLSKKLVGIFEL